MLFEGVECVCVVNMVKCEMWSGVECVVSEVELRVGDGWSRVE